ncbi:MAG: ribonuclease H-like domain-containing protein [Pirellulales bacterium]|nr:ribonuclease H-like domain-containing protein [Pirellulales bacterium]
MKRKYLAFDIETAKDLPGEDFDWRAHRPLGICCAAALPEGAEQPIVWQGKTPEGTPAGQLSRSEARSVVDELVDFLKNGYTLLTWNGLGFDLDVLAEESGDRKQCKALAVGHVDMMFHVFCDRGFPVALDKAAQALRIPGKPPGMSGVLAPGLWAEGRYQEVIDYVSGDVRITLKVAVECEKRRRFDWITRRGTTSSMNLPRGWLSVEEALRLPEPDTSWMDSAIPRHHFTRWIDKR